MKKSLIALAVLSTIAGSAVAQSSVTVYGRFDQSFNKVETVTTSTSTATNTGLDGGIGGSRLGFRGTEDIGGGLKANFVVEFGVDMGENTGAGATRLGFADISGSAGTFRMGRQVSPTKAVADSYNALGNNTNFTPGDVGALTGFDNRISNAITYLTPTMNGFSAQVMFADANTKTTTEDSTNLLNGSAGADGSTVGFATGVPGSTTTSGYRVSKQGEVKAAGINYTAGKLALAYAMQDQTSMDAGTEANNEITIAAATYDFGFLKAHLDQTTRKISNVGVNVANRKVTTIGVTAPVRANLLLAAQYFDGDRKAGTGSSTGNFNTSVDTAADYSGYKVRATYVLSKRTGLYGQLGKTETTVVSSGAKTTVEGYGLGMYHTF
jgi:predicted porin